MTHPSELQSVGGAVIVGALADAVRVDSGLDLHGAGQHRPFVTAKVRGGIGEVRSGDRGTGADREIDTIRGVGIRVDVGATDDAHVGSGEALLRRRVEGGYVAAPKRFLDGELHNRAVLRVDRARKHRADWRSLILHSTTEQRCDDKRERRSSFVGMHSKIPLWIMCPGR